MELDNNERKIVLAAVDAWHNEGRLSAQQAEDLKNSIVPKKVGQQLANYFFIIALACALLSFSALFIDEKFLERFRQYFALSNWAIAILTALFAALWYRYIYQKRMAFRPLTYDMQLTGASVVMLTSLVYLCKEIGSGTGYTTLLALAVFLLAGLFYLFRSTALWIGVLMAAMGWFGAFAYVHSTNSLFLGMNYPVRFAVFGIFLTAMALLQRRLRSLLSTYRITLIFALLIFFTAMWGVSIFGNYNDLQKWQEVRQVQVLVYGILFGIASVAALYAGVKNDDVFVRDIGVIFLLLNLYTRYFEYFWDTLNKGLFFLIIAVSFWLVGRWLIKRHGQKPA